MISSRVSLLATLLCSLFDSTSARPSTRNILLNEIRSPSANLSAYSPVLTDGTASLPTPTGTLTYITLGRGTQNYTCASSASSVPVSIGATAALFNVTQVLPEMSVSDGQAYLNTLPSNEVDDSISQIQASGLPIVGHHYFTAAGVPTWNLSCADRLLYGSGVGDIPAPPDANPGPQGYGAIDWKSLTAKAGSVGLTEVYRVETAGGKPPLNCSGFEGTTVLVQYAAMYWFYD